MRGLFLVARRELGGYLNSYLGYLVAAFVLVIVLLLPAPREPLGRSSVVADVLEDYREKLAELFGSHFIQT